jgi:hypothetical protein
MKVTRVFLIGFFFSAYLFATNMNQKEDLSESLPVGEMIINLAQSIVQDLHPPAQGAERKVTNAGVTYGENTVAYYIEGKDVLHNDRVLSTYWIRLTKKINPGFAEGYSLAVGSGASPKEGITLLPETQEFIAVLLNGIYDVVELDLEHKRVKLDRIVKLNQDPLSFEIYGVNQICKHVELNNFKITITRNVDDRNRSSYRTELVHPYHEELLDPSSRCGKYWPC